MPDRRAMRWAPLIRIGDKVRRLRPVGWHEGRSIRPSRSTWLRRTSRLSRARRSSSRAVSRGPVPWRSIAGWSVSGRPVARGTIAGRLVIGWPVTGRPIIGRPVSWWAISRRSVVGWFLLWRPVLRRSILRRPLLGRPILVAAALVTVLSQRDRLQRQSGEEDREQVTESLHGCTPGYHFSSVLYGSRPSPNGGGRSKGGTIRSPHFEHGRYSSK